MFARIFGYLKALFGIKMDAWEDPEVLLKQAQDEMKEAHAKNRERAVQAITQKNNLQAEVDKTQKMIDNLQAKAEIALKNGDRDLALQLLREKQTYETNMTSLKASLQNAIEVTEQIKVAIQREEERIRTKTAQAMAMKTQWKQAQIENSINKALDNMQADGTDAAFERAASKISNARSESSARTELAKGRIENRIAALDDVQADSAASQELAALEQKLGLAPATATPATTTTASTTTTTTTTDAAEKELAELEAKVSAGGGQPPASA